MRGEKLVEEGVDHLVAIVGEVQIVFLIDGLELSVEAADDHVLEAVGLDASPVLNLVRRNILHINRLVERCVGVGAVGTDKGHQLVVLVGDIVLSCELRHAVDLVVGLSASGRVGQLAVGLEALLNLVEQRSLGHGVGGAELLGALEHKVLEVVGQTGSLGWIVARTCLHSDVSLDARLVFIDAEVDFQSVLERVDARFHWVALDALVIVTIASRKA